MILSKRERAIGFVAVLVFLILAALLCFADAKIAFYVRVALEPLAIGVSQSQRIFMLLWLAASFGALLIFPRCSPLPRRGSYMCAALVFAIGVALHLYFSAVFKIPLGAYGVFVAQGIESSSSLTHLHLMKGVMALPEYLLDIPVSDLNIDNGIALMAFIPWPLFAISAILWLRASAGLFVNSRSDFSAFGPESRWAAITIVSIASGDLVRTMLDGGAFCGQAFAAFFLLAAVSYCRKHAFKRVWILVLLWSVVGAVCFGIASESTVETGINSFKLYVQKLSFTCAVGLFIQLLMVPRRVVLRLSIIAALCALTQVSSSGLPEWWESKRLRDQPLVEAQPVFIMAAAKFLPDETPLYQESKNFLIYRKEPAGASNVLELFRRLPIPISRFSFSIAGVDCLEGNPYGITGRIIPVSGAFEQRKPAADSPVLEYRTESCADSVPGFCYYVKVKGCVPNRSSMLENAFFSNRGLAAFIALPDRSNP